MAIAGDVVPQQGWWFIKVDDHHVYITVIVEIGKCRSTCDGHQQRAQRRGLVQRESASRGHVVRYTLTDAGQELVPIVWAIGTWAARWLYTDPTDEDRACTETTPQGFNCALDSPLLRTLEPATPAQAKESS